MKLILISIGLLSLVLGIIGIFLPVLPTTPFLLLSAALFARSSDRLYNWLITHRILGEYIRSFREDKALTISVKTFSIGLMWLVTMLNILFFIKELLWIQLLLVVISTCVSVHILSYATRKNRS